MRLNVVRLRRLAAPVCALAVLASLSAAPSPAPAATTAITEGSLDWGIKESWRNYVGGGEVSEGATVNPDGTYSFPVTSGSFDDETKTTVLNLAGRVQWRAYPDYRGPGLWGLDTTYKDLTVTIGPTQQVVRGTHIGYLQGDPGGAMVTDADVVLAKLDVLGATTSFGSGTSSWGAVPASAGAGLRLYFEGTQIDPLSIEYSGPGGVPDLGEHWDTPGSLALQAGARWVSDKAFGTASNSGRQIFASGAGDVVHVVELTGAGTANALLIFTARDAETLAQIGTPAQVTYPVANQGQYLRTGFDPETDSLFFVRGREGESQREIRVRVARWDRASGSYEPGIVGSLPDHATNAGGTILNRAIGAVVWNPVEDEVAVSYGDPGADLYDKDALRRFWREDDAWVSSTARLRMPDTGPYAGATTTTSPFSCSGFADTRCLGVARDGSYVQAPSNARVVTPGGELRWPAIHVTVDEAGLATSAPIAGTALGPDQFGSYFGLKSAVPGADGSVLLHRTDSLADSFARVDVVGGQAQLIGDVYNVNEHLENPPETPAFGASMAADAGRGWEWATDSTDPESFVLSAIEGGEIFSRHRQAEFSPQGYPMIAVHPDGSVYLPLKDAASGRFAYERLELVGELAVPVLQPASAAVALAVGEDSEPVAFSSTVGGGDPAPARQWQLKAPGESTFSDLPGETGETLSVDAERGMDGSQYRAVYTSPAGRIVSDVATLAVDHAPQLALEPANRSVAEGADAVFLLTANGNPEPTISWQRRVAGFWEPIAPDDENVVVNGPSLTVVDTNAEQSGALFRAKLTNSVATVYSRAATLTVTPKIAIPEDGLDLENVSLDWTGSEELQKAPPFGGSNYFSAGASDGDEATYRSVAGNAAIFQVSSTGAEAVATWATRAGHLQGGGAQLARLFGGEGRIEADGATTVAWDGAFSVNFYGGMVPFTLTDPELTVAADGSGTLAADLSGYASSQANPNEREPLAPVADVTVATFSGVEVDPAGTLTVAPDYTGVEVTVPVPYAAQNRTAVGWGAWPQPFVDFHAKTGLSSYWYSSGGSADPYKRADPFVVDFDGVAAPPEPPAEPQPDRDPVAAAPGPAPSPASPPQASPPMRPRLNAIRTARLGSDGVAAVARVGCPGPATCQIHLPRWVRVRIAGKAYRAEVLAPKVLKPGAEARIKLRLPGPALNALGGSAATATLRLRIPAGDGAMAKTARVRIVSGA